LVIKKKIVLKHIVIRPEVPGVEPESSEAKPEVPGVKPESSGAMPEVPGAKPEFQVLQYIGCK
jgi:hypothetical protein